MLEPFRLISAGGICGRTTPKPETQEGLSD